MADIPLPPGQSQALIGAGGTLLGILIKFVWDGFKKKSDDTDAKIEKIEDTVNKTLVVVARLETKLDNAKEKFDLVGKVRIDVADLGSKVRSMDDRLHHMEDKFEVDN